MINYCDAICELNVKINFISEEQRETLSSTISVRQPGSSFNGKTVHQHFKSKIQTVLKRATIMKRMNMIIIVGYMLKFQLRKSVMQSQAMMFLENFELHQAIFGKF